MRIDAHQHFWQIARSDYGWLGPHLPALWRDFGPQDLKPILDRHEISATVLVQAAPSVAETNVLLAIADAAPWVGAVVGWIDFDDPAHRQHLERWAQHPKFCGVRPMLQDIAETEWILDPRRAWAFDALADLDLRFEFLGTPRHLDVALKLARRHPTMPIVLNHALKPQIRDQGFEPWATNIAAVAEQSRVVCKLSGLVTEAATGWSEADLEPYVSHVVRTFGPERLMWGSDWPVVTLAASYDAWWTATQKLLRNVAGRDDILGGTAARFYRIGGKAAG